MRTESWTRTCLTRVCYGISPTLFDNLKELDEEEAAGELKKLEGSWLTKKIRSRLILTDIEQNFFRGSIRMPAEEQMNYHIFFSYRYYPELVYLI